jgi:hypothetical protein
MSLTLLMFDKHLKIKVFLVLTFGFLCGRITEMKFLR